MTEPIHVEAVNRDLEIALMSDGSTLPLLSHIDADGELCDAADAVVSVAGLEGFGWVTIKHSEFDATPTQ